jgi:hypothetical protein
MVLNSIHGGSAEAHTRYGCAVSPAKIVRRASWCRYNLTDLAHGEIKGRCAEDKAAFSTKFGNDFAYTFR